MLKSETPTVLLSYISAKGNHLQTSNKGRRNAEVYGLSAHMLQSVDRADIKAASAGTIEETIKEKTGIKDEETSGHVKSVWGLFWKKASKFSDQEWKDIGLASDADAEDEERPMKFIVLMADFVALLEALLA